VTESASLGQALELAAFDDIWRRQHLLSFAASKRALAVPKATEKVIQAALQLLERTPPQ